LPVFRAYPQAVSLLTTDALVLDRIGVGTMFVDASDVFLTGAPYADSCSFFGQPPASNQLIGAHFFPVSVAFGANMATTLGASGGGCLSNPTSTFTAVVKHLAGGVQSTIGTMTITTGGVLSFATSAATIAGGDSLLFFGPSSPDATVQDIWWTILGAIA
jgi:hypothetical protein